MSREQWGNGYWTGVDDALHGRHIAKDHKGEVKEITALYYLCHMALSNVHKMHNRSLYPVRELIIRLGIDYYEKDAVRMAKEIYDFIQEQNPFGCYVTGASYNDWQEDDFVLVMGPAMTEKRWATVLKAVERRQREIFAVQIQKRENMLFRKIEKQLLGEA